VEDSLLLKMFVLYVGKAPQSQATSSANSKQVQDAVLVGDDELSGASSEHSDYPNDDSDADSEKEEIDEDLEAPCDAGSNLDAPLTSMAKTVVKGPRNSQRAVSKKAAKAPTQKGMTWPESGRTPKEGHHRWKSGSQRRWHGGSHETSTGVPAARRRHG
jgi:cytoskeletal protein RodZ